MDERKENEMAHQNKLPNDWGFAVFLIALLIVGMGMILATAGLAGALAEDSPLWLKAVTSWQLIALGAALPSESANPLEQSPVADWLFKYVTIPAVLFGGLTHLLFGGVSLWFGRMEGVLFLWPLLAVALFILACFLERTAQRQSNETK